MNQNAEKALGIGLLSKIIKTFLGFLISSSTRSTMVYLTRMFQVTCNKTYCYCLHWGNTRCGQIKLNRILFESVFLQNFLCTLCDDRLNPCFPHTDICRGSTDLVLVHTKTAVKYKLEHCCPKHEV